jgi:acyl carrier protein
MTAEGIRRTLREFFAHTFPDRALHDDDDIFALGFGNSLFAMQLVEYLEHEFGIVVENDDLDIENFRTIAAMAELVERKTRLRVAG